VTTTQHVQVEVKTVRFWTRLAGVKPFTTLCSPRGNSDARSAKREAQTAEELISIGRDGWGSLGGDFPLSTS